LISIFGLLKNNLVFNYLQNSNLAKAKNSGAVFL